MSANIMHHLVSPRRPGGINNIFACSRDFPPFCPCFHPRFFSSSSFSGNTTASASRARGSGEGAAPSRTAPPGVSTTAQRFQLPEALSPRQLDVRENIRRTRPTTGLAGPFAPWLLSPELADAAQNLGRVCRYETTSLTQRERELCILLTAVFHSCETEFRIHEPEARAAGLDESVISLLQDAGARSWSSGRREGGETAPPETQGRPNPSPVRPVDLSGQCDTPPIRHEHGRVRAEQEVYHIVDDLDDIVRRVILQLDDKRLAVVARFTAALLRHSGRMGDELYAECAVGLGGDEGATALVELTSITGYYTYVAYTLNLFQIDGT